VFNYGGFCEESLFGRGTELQLRNEDFIQKGNRAFLTIEILMQGVRGKSRIKNYRSDHHEFRDFW
jgi:hypothetical protein